MDTRTRVLILTLFIFGERLGDTFVTAKLAGIINRAASAQEGERNAVTFWCGCRLAEMVRDQMIGRDEALALLIEASSRTGLPQREILRTVRSAFRSLSGHE